MSDVFEHKSDFDKKKHFCFMLLSGYCFNFYYYFLIIKTFYVARNCTFTKVLFINEPEFSYKSSRL